MKLRLFDTLSRSVRDFDALNPPGVGLYTCGMTVYDYAHIGNLRTYVFNDILRRTLAYNGYEVLHVMNITDVGHLVSDADTGEDKIEKGSRRTGKTAWEIAEKYTEAFRQDIKALSKLTEVDGSLLISSNTITSLEDIHNQTKTYISCMPRFVTVFTLKKSQAHSVSLCRSMNSFHESEVRSGPGDIPSSLRMFRTVWRLIFLIPILRSSPMMRVYPNPVVLAM